MRVRFLKSVYENHENGYCVFRYTTKDDIGEPSSAPKQQSLFAIETVLTAVGYYLPSAKNIEYEFEGVWVNNEKFGRQFEVTSYESFVPDTKEGLISFLSSGLIKGIGKKTARTIVNEFGLDTINVIENNPDELLKIKGISKNKIEKILDSYQTSRALKDVISFLAPYDIGINKIMRVYKTFGPRTINIIKTNPFSLCEVEGFGFKTVDAIARKVKFAPNAKERIQTAAIYLLNDAQTSGHLFLEKREFRNKLFSLLNDAFETPCVSQKEADDAVINMINTGILMTDEDAIYTKRCFEAEGNATVNVVNMLLSKSYNKSPREKDIKDVENALNIRLADKQKEALSMCLENNFSIITGGPGTGKTTTLRAILSLYRNYFNDKILLMAPTGKAARRMEESTGIPANTIHSTLKLKADESIDDEDGEVIKNTFIVVDEFSMVDMFLANALFRHIGKGSKLLLVGDPDQLPSVGPGNVFRELIESGVIPVTVLDVVYRQAETSPIVANATKINTGDCSIEYGPDFELVQTADDEEAKKEIIERYSEYVATYGIENVQILSPYRTKSEIGVNRLNEEIQCIINPSNEKKKEVRFGSHIFREGDRVMQIKNTEHASNGDVGVISQIDIDEDDEELTVTIIFSGNRKLFYAKEDLEHLDLAYAATVHKSQGSEYNVVILAMTTTFYIMLKRNLLYTAVTRAKDKVVIIGQNKAVLTAIRRNDIDKRNTKLGAKIKKLGFLLSQKEAY